jgi:PKD repeat protein
VDRWNRFFIGVALTLAGAALPGAPAAAEPGSTFVPVADAYVRSSAPSANFGTAKGLRVRSTGPEMRSYLKFSVTGLDGPVTSATLRLRVSDTGPDGGTVHVVSSAWEERSITWANAPAVGETPLTSVGQVTVTRTWVNIDVTPAVTGDGTYSFAIAGGTTDLVQYESRETANDPQLVVQTGPTPLSAGFSASPVTGDAPLLVSFTDTSTGAPASWSWDFGDGSAPSTEQHPTHSYTGAGTYTVTLTVGNATETSTSARPDLITVTEPGAPTAAFDATPTSGTAPLAVQFTDTTTGAPESWTWDFGDGSPSSPEQHPSHVYAGPGQYLVTLTVTNTAGTDSATRTITVQSATATSECSGYPEWRTFLESQVWWEDTTAPFPGRHIHLGTCFPLHQVVSGVVHFDLHIQAHQHPGTISKIAVEAFGNGAIQSKAVDITCSVDDCDWWVPFDFDSTRTDYNGRWEFRLRAIAPVTPNGATMYNSTRWHATIDNPGKPLRDANESADRSPGGAGWYTGVNYMNVFCSDGGFSLVHQPVSGVVQLTCRFDRENAFASVDPSFHAVPPGPGAVVLDSGIGGVHVVTIDTTTLTNGRHKLVLRTDAVGRKPAGIGSGVLVLSFEVQN